MYINNSESRGVGVAHTKAEDNVRASLPGGGTKGSGGALGLSPVG